MNSNTPGKGQETVSFLGRLFQLASPQTTESSSVLANKSDLLPSGVQKADDALLSDREELVNEISDEYFNSGFDSIDFELHNMGVDVESEELAQLAERRSSALDIIHDTLSSNILKEYENFNHALNGIARLQEVLGAAKVNAKISRESLSRASLEVKHGIAVWKNAQKKKSISSTLDMLKKLQSARRILEKSREDMENENYGIAVQECGACGDAVSELLPLGIRAADLISRDANDLLCDIAEQMYETLLSMTTQFDPVRYSNLLEGYSYITDSTRVVGGAELSPTQEIVSAYTSSPYAKVKKVIGSILYSKLDGRKVSADSSLMDLLAQIPADSFRLCIQQVLKVEYDIMCSFYSLEQWHHRNSSSGKTHAERMIAGIRDALPRGRRLIWNEISGSLMNVLQAVKLGHGENFIVVSKWVNEFLKIGHAFSGESPEALQGILSQQALRFFKGHHLNSIEALQTVLERETYKVIDIELPWVQENGSLDVVRDHTIDSSKGSLDDLMTKVNPWNTDSEDVHDILSHVKAVFHDEHVALGDGETLSTINSLWRLIKWMMEYVSLMYDLPSATPAIATGLTELIDIFVLHVYSTFVGQSLTVETMYCSESLDEYIRFMRETSLGKYKRLLQSSSPESALTRILCTEKSTKNIDKFSHASAISNSGNLYGFVERIVTSSSLKELGEFLRQLGSLFGKFTTTNSVELEKAQYHFARVSNMLPDVIRSLQGSCCSLLLPLTWLPEAVSQGHYLPSEPPSIASDWTYKLARQLELLAAQLESVQGVSPDAAVEMWSFVFPAVSKAIVAGLSRVKKCTLEGRAAMSLDLQAVSKTLNKTQPWQKADIDPNVSSLIDTQREAAIRSIDDYIKGFYVPLADLHVWAEGHPLYSIPQVLALASCIAESSGMKKKDITSAIEEMEGHLIKQVRNAIT